MNARQLRAMHSNLKKGHDACGVCGSALPYRGTCKRCDKLDAKKAMNWSTMKIGYRERFLQTNGLENTYAIKQIAKQSYSGLTSHWKDTLKQKGYGK